MQNPVSQQQQEQQQEQQQQQDCRQKMRESWVRFDMFRKQGLEVPPMLLPPVAPVLPPLVVPPPLETSLDQLTLQDASRKRPHVVILDDDDDDDDDDAMNEPAAAADTEEPVRSPLPVKRMRLVEPCESVTCMSRDSRPGRCSFCCEDSAETLPLSACRRTPVRHTLCLDCIHQMGSRASCVLCLLQQQA